MTGEPEGLRAPESEEPSTDETPATVDSSTPEVAQQEEVPAEAVAATPEPEPDPDPQTAPAPSPSNPVAAPTFPPDLPNPRPIAPAPPVDSPAVASEPTPEPEPSAEPAAELSPSEPEAVAQPSAVATPTPEPAAAVAPETPTPDLMPTEPVHDEVPGIPSADDTDTDDDDPAELYEALLESYAPQAPDFRVGDRKVGHIVSASDDGVVVDIGAKTEGFISLRDAPTGEDRPTFNVGEEIGVIITRLGEPGEYVFLAPARDENREVLDALDKAHEEKQPVNAKVLERVKGGLTVDIGVPAFLPGSQLALRGVQNLDSFLGQEFPVLIVKMSRRRGNVVVSRRAVLEEETGKLKQETLAKLSLGAEATGTVKNVTSYGAFIDLGGIDGLIHVTDISHGRLKDPSEALTPGQEVTAKVIKLDPEKERVSLSLKEMQTDPWDGVTERYTTGDKVSGEVASITDYGAFIELESGVEGLVHISELTWSKRLRHPSKVLKAGQQVDAVVLKVQPSARRISLSLKNLEPDPWASLGTEFEVGAIVEGRVRNVTSYGAFVEIREGIDGLVHVSDLSWDSSVRNPKDVLKKGEMIKAVVLGLDSENRRMSFGIKQLQPDVWETFFSQYGVGDVLLGLVTRHAKFGVFAQLTEGVEGLCHNSEMPPRSQRKGKQRLDRGRRYEFEIIRLDEYDHRIGLRCKSYDPMVDPVETLAEAPPALPPEESSDPAPLEQAAELAPEPASEPAPELVAEPAPEQTVAETTPEPAEASAAPLEPSDAQAQPETAEPVEASAEVEQPTQEQLEASESPESVEQAANPKDSETVAEPKAAETSGETVESSGA